MFPNHKDTDTEDAEPYVIKLYCNQPFASSLFILSCLHASGSRYLSVLAGITSRNITSERLRLIRVRGRGGHECEFTQDMSVRSHRIQVCVRGKCEAVTVTCRTYTHYLYISSSNFGCSQQPFLTTNYTMFFMIISNGTPKRTFLSRVHFNTNL